MSNEYSLKEIIRFAIEIEKEGSLFYQKIADKIRDINLKNIFLNLKTEENFHKQKFEEMLRNLGEDDNEYLYNLDNEYILYLKSFIENAIFNKKDIDILITTLNTTEAIINYAVDRENDSINFYNNMKKVVKSEYHITLDKIIGEEYLHKEKLENIKRLKYNII